jgi:hypothetical protein
MKDNLTANQLTGRAIGTIFFAGFGAIWLFLSLYVREQLSAAAVSGVVAGALVLLLGALYLFRQAKRWPRTPDAPAVSRAFGWINAIQWIAGGVAAYSLARLHLDAYVVNAITVIVGLHMFPLARLFHYPMHHATGAALVAWSLITIPLVPAEHLQGLAALGTGMILWLSAAVTQVLALRAAQRPVEPQLV